MPRPRLHVKPSLLAPGFGVLVIRLRFFPLLAFPFKSWSNKHFFHFKTRFLLFSSGYAPP